MAKTKMTLRVDEDWHWAVKAAAVQLRMTVTDLIVAAVDAKLAELAKGEKADGGPDNQ